MDSLNNTETKSQNASSPNREYKDSVFVDLHSNDIVLREQAVMDIYNALHDKKIDKKDKIRFMKLEHVFFHKVRNDVSFIVEGKILVLLEHQSTINENMPYRCLEYSVAMFLSQMKPRDKFLPSPVEFLPPNSTLYIMALRPILQERSCDFLNLLRSKQIILSLNL